MNITAIRTFLAVVETGHLNKAADRLNVTQSTVTARLDALDAALGQPLLVRSRRGAQLTRAGFTFRPHAETLVRSWEQAQNAVGLPHGFSALFSFACEVDLWPSAGQAWFDTARQAHPDLAFEAWPGSRDEIREWLANGLTDAALTTEPLAAFGVVSRDFARERLVLVTTKPRASGETGSAYIHVDHGAEFRQHDAQVGTHAHTARVTYASGAWALDHMLTEGGSAYLPAAVCAPYLERGDVSLVAGAADISRTIYITLRKHSHRAFPWVLDLGPTGLEQPAQSSDLRDGT